MSRPRLTVLRSTTLRPDDLGEGSVATWEEIRDALAETGLRRNLWRYPAIDLVTRDVDRLHRPLVTDLLLRLLTWHRCTVRDESGRRRAVSWWRVARDGAGAVRDRLGAGRLEARVSGRVQALRARLAERHRAVGTLRVDRRPLHLRTDLVYGLSSGGSVGHIAGVLNHVGEVVGPPVFATTDRIPTVRDDVETHLLVPPARWWDFTELLMLACNETFVAQLERFVPEDPCFVYQRYSTHSFAGLEMALRRRAPFVLEFNGSERWIARHWGGSPLVYDELAGRIERLNLEAADLVVAVSDAARDQAIECGAPPEKVLVDPNGVDTARFRPDVDGRDVRKRLAVDDRLVVGFIGTFGAWHGTEVLAEAFCRWMEDVPADRPRTALVMIGSGPLWPGVSRTFVERGMVENAHCVGRVPQEEGPRWLAACDVLVSPHVPNPDGSRFFGSPTKLFEYMAMGRPIVASRLEQIGEVLEHERTALLVPPGDVDALAAALRRLAGDADLRRRLGAAAREAAERHHTWRRHTERFVEALRERLERRPGETTPGSAA